MRNNKKILYFAGFIFSIPIALTSYINSSFLEGYINEKYVGAIYILASILTIWWMLKMPKILLRFGNIITTIIFLAFNFISLLTMAFANSIYFILPAFILFFISINFLFTCFDIFIEDASQNASIGKFRGLFLMFVNLAWVFAQLVSGSIINKSSFQGIYLLASSFVFLLSIIIIFGFNKFKDPKYTKVSILKTIKVFIKNKNISKIYLINLILKLFFAWMVIYIPIYLYEYMNFSWKEMGLIFTIMLIPFVLLDYPLGKLSDKIGEKRILIVGFLVAIFFTFLIPFINVPAIWLWAIVLFGTRIGAAIIEVMSEGYFFKEIKEKNADEVSFFRNTYPMSYLLAPIVAIPTLMLTPSLKYLFFVVVIFLIIGFAITLRIKDIK